MKTMTKFLISFFMLFLMACTTASLKCKLQETLVDAVAPAIAVNLQCSNKDAVYKDIEAVIGTIGFCPKSETKEGKQLPLPVCSLIADLVVDNVARFSIPITWGCTAQNAKDLLKGVIVKGCTGA